MRRLAGGRFDARPRTPARPRRIVFDGLVKAFKQWRRWRIGTIHEVGWIADGTTPGISITAAIPLIFEAYATFYEPDGLTIITHERTVVDRLAEHTSDQLWWLKDPLIKAHGSSPIATPSHHGASASA